MYHTVRIRDLAPPLPQDANRKIGCYQSETSSISNEYWTGSINKSSGHDRYRSDSNPEKYRPVYFEANGPHTHVLRNGHALLEAYLAAYNAHEDLVLSPDDIWLMITIYYSRYVGDNAEQMRYLFVDHEGKKELVVEIFTMEPDWPNFLIQMQSKIGTRVKNDVVDVLTSNFSTTGLVECLLSSACIMHTFKKYFDYTHCMVGCGIRNVHFMGTLDDWQLLRKKAEDLKMFTLPSSSQHSPGDFRGYIDGVLPVLDQLIRTYKGDVDNDFWDTIFDYTKVQVVGGSGILMNMDAVRGWFLRLCYGYHLSSSSGGVALRDIALGAISVPVKLVDMVKGGKQSSCYVVGGFHGIHSSKDGKHRPVMSLAVHEDIESTSESDISGKHPTNNSSKERGNGILHFFKEKFNINSD